MIFCCEFGLAAKGELIPTVGDSLRLETMAILMKLIGYVKKKLQRCRAMA